jgi:glycosyltransferase involved in cell wall biosynthesis
MADESHLWPLVSVIVPVFNGERYLRESLDSLLAQTYPRFEILVMDDASTDSTADILASYKDRITTHRQPRNGGQFTNVNDGILRARGEYVAVYHADDIYEPTIVEREVAFLQAYPEAAAVFSLSVFIDVLGRECGRVRVPAEVKVGGPVDHRMILHALLLHKNTFICGPTSMVRASVYKDVGPYREDVFGIASDLEMWVRIAEKRPIGILDEYLHRYRFGHGNLSQKYYRHRTELERYFHIMDECLRRRGSDTVVADAMAAFEAYRAEDYLMIAVNLYILDRRTESAETLGRVRVRALLASRNVQTWRLLFLFLVMKVLVRLPRIGFVAGLFHRRWHVNKYAKLTPELRPLLEIK